MEIQKTKKKRFYQFQSPTDQVKKRVFFKILENRTVGNPSQGVSGKNRGKKIREMKRASWAWAILWLREMGRGK